MSLSQGGIRRIADWLDVELLVACMSMNSCKVLRLTNGDNSAYQLHVFTTWLEATVSIYEICIAKAACCRKKGSHMEIQFCRLFTPVIPYTIPALAVISEPEYIVYTYLLRIGINDGTYIIMAWKRLLQ